MGCYPSEDYFLEKEGIFLLLDLMAVSMIITIVKQKINVFINFPNWVSQNTTLWLNVPSNSVQIFVLNKNPSWSFIVCIGIVESENSSSEETSLLRSVFPNTWQPRICSVLFCFSPWNFKVTARLFKNQ